MWSVGMKRLVKIVGAAVVLYAVACAALFAAMIQSPDVFAGVMRHVPWPAFMLLPSRTLWLTARSGSLRVGDTAPDFDLETVGRKSRIRLSSLRGYKPVVLVFGSYT